jgi:prevent-host-death family protein
MRKAKTDSKATHEEVTAKNVKSQLGRLLSRVGFGNERIVITRNGERVAALVSAQDLERLDRTA